MIAPIFSVCFQDSALLSLLGSSPMRLYPFGEHYDNITYPYVVWQNIGGIPENFLGNRPDIDSFSIQVDVYADTATSAISVAKAVRDAVEGHAYITRWGTQEIDSETRKYRYSFDIDWYVKR